MIEIREPEKDWVVRSENSDGLCPVCQFFLPLRARGSNKDSLYCSRSCLVVDQLPNLPSHKSSESR